MGDMAVTVPTTRFRIGVDVGGTNTDAALVACQADTSPQGPKSILARTLEVVASSKAETTADVTTGISNAIRNVLGQYPVPTTDILSINIGTTHFINAVTQRDASKLRRVAVLRLCGPFGREVPPFADWPADLAAVLKGPIGYLSGGLELDGRLIGEVSKDEVLQHAENIMKAGITAVVVIGVFSSLDSESPTQEEYVRKLLQDRIPGIDVVCSRDVGNAPFVERENAAILNASILDFGRRTIRSFESAFQSLDLDCALYLTQNDGTVMDTEAAVRVPIKTFTSGATNSLTGAMFLAGLHNGSEAVVDPKTSQVIMVDIGGTTSDFAALSPTGYPRQSPGTVKVGGVRTAFQLPELVSIGLGGGSRVVVTHESGSDSSVTSTSNSRVTVGPTSVGYQLSVLAQCFGGEVLTATDIAVASGVVAEGTVGTQKVDLDADVVTKARRNIRRQLEYNIENMRVSDQEVVLLLVGGGSIIQMDDIRNVKACIRPPFYNVANAVGAAIAKISGDVDQIEIPGDRNPDDIVEEMKNKAIEAACQNGAIRESVRIVEVERIPLQYAHNAAFRVVVRACGDLSWDSGETKKRCKAEATTGPEPAVRPVEVATKLVGLDITPNDVHLASYEPEVSKATGEWFISEIDLAFIAEGCGVLGTGGGGSSYAAYLNSIAVLRKSPRGSMRVIDPSTIDASSRVGIVAGVGAPSVSNERLAGENEFQYACQKLLRYLQLDSFSALASGEIGGGNGMAPFPVAATMGLPVLDGDTLGRAFPKIDMCLPFVYDTEKPYPGVLSDPRGNSQIVAEVDTANRLERLLRCICIEMGLSCAYAFSIGAENFQKYACSQTVSEAWYIGRAISIARQQKTDILQSLVNIIPGCKKIYSGRITDVSRDVKGGWTVGTVTIKRASEDGDDDDGSHTQAQMNDNPMIIQYQNEFLYAALMRPDGSQEAICTTPDLITVLDAAGAALGTHEMRYGLMVHVIAMPANPLWTTPTGMKASDPASFGLAMEYTALGSEWHKPRSVIEEFGK
ncbi:hypothetical protein GQ53DRAFT_799011 [Thozetella sp. PMI_491]|nr:hypothetical protein GQ53DRAFT_799011 [Thozetella sp. PMI_491]